VTLFDYFCFFFLMIWPAPRSTLFPYTTLFRSLVAYEAEHREEMRRLEIAGRARHLACKRLLGCNAVDRRRKELERRRESDRVARSEEHTSELQSPCNLVCRLLLEKKKKRSSSS